MSKSPLRDFQTRSLVAEVTSRALVDVFFSRVGFPLEIFSDQGRNFQSHLFAKLCEITQIHQAMTTSYRPSGNGQVERFNRTLMDAAEEAGRSAEWQNTGSVPCRTGRGND